MAEQECRAKKSLGNMKIKITADVDDFNESIEKSVTKLKSLKKALRAVIGDIKELENDIGKVAFNSIVEPNGYYEDEDGDKWEQSKIIGKQLIVKYDLGSDDNGKDNKR